MKGEINKDFYCPLYLDDKCSKYEDPEIGCHTCSCIKHKYPTLEQFEEEYGEEWEGAVYVKCSLLNCTENCYKEWILYPSIKGAIPDMCEEATKINNPIFICACTPWGKPTDDWRPK
jgi:hypothetical protein